MRRYLPLMLACGASLAFAGQEQAPDWVREIATRTIPSYPPEVKAVTLFDESHITVNPDGSTLGQNRFAVRILTPEARRRAEAFVPYYNKVTKIREFKAWLVLPDGTTKAFGKNDVADVSVQAGYELYTDERGKMITAENATPGSTFVWTAQIEDHPNVPEEVWSFQERDPVLISRFSLTVPAGWEAKAVLFNHDPVQPAVENNTYTWELKDLAHVRHEERSPDVSPWLGLTYYAANNTKAAHDWKDISIRETALDEPRATTSDELNAETHQMTSASANTLDQIRAVSKFVQQLKYVEIATDLAHGGGYLPHAAADVYAKRYGDCKDKANLMRTMLRQIGVQSYMIAVYSPDRNHVHPEWPSGTQFNHMILAIKVSDAVDLPAVTAHPALGKLLIFDSTDAHTPLGLLPDYEQGSYGLLLAADKGGIIQLPVARPEANRTEVAVEGSLSGSGALEARITMKSRADEARFWRELKEDKPAQFDTALRAWLEANVRQVDANKIEAKDAFDSGEMDLNFDFKAPRYAQLMQGRLLVFRPSILEPGFSFPLQSEKRQNPVVLNSESLHKEVHVKLPDGFTVDELPDPASFSSSFGKYSAQCKVTGNEVTFTEDLDTVAITLPADQYTQAREFFGKVAGVEKTPLVLVKN